MVGSDLQFPVISVSNLFFYITGYLYLDTTVIVAELDSQKGDIISILLTHTKHHSHHSHIVSVRIFQLALRQFVHPLHMYFASSSRAHDWSRPCIFATAVNLPQLTEKDARGIRAFLREYDQYVSEVTERGRQIVGDHIQSTDIVKPFQIKFCCDFECLESIIDLYLFPSVAMYDDLIDGTLRPYLDSKAVSSKDIVAIDTLDRLLKNRIRILMNEKDAQSRIENLFIIYKSLLRRHSFS